MAKPVVLVAAPPFAVPTLRRALENDVDLIPVYRLAEAISKLEHPSQIALILAAMYFDESRMFELVEYVKEKYPTLPCVCCRIVDTKISRESVEGAVIAAANAGAEAFVDLPKLTGKLGDDGAKAQLRSSVLKHLRSDAHPSPQPR